MDKQDVLAICQAVQVLERLDKVLPRDICDGFNLMPPCCEAFEALQELRAVLKRNEEEEKAP